MTWIALIRVEQWIKNLVVFAAVIFGAKAGEVSAVGRSSAAFFIFCMISSAAYIFNDVLDRERDRVHPVKRYRPIADGRIPVGSAMAVCIFLTVAALGASWFLGRFFTVTVLTYMGLNLLYNFFLKQVVILDVMCIALGFVLRAVAGGLAIPVHVSSWLLLCTLLLALFLGLAKRRHEHLLLDKDALVHRQILKEYTPYFLDQLIVVVVASTFVLYILYTMLGELRIEHGVQHLELTVPFVLYGILRYLYLIHHRRSGGSPTRTFLSDPALLTDVFFWALVSLFLIYRD